VAKLLASNSLTRQVILKKGVEESEKLKARSFLMLGQERKVTWSSIC